MGLCFKRLLPFSLAALLLAGCAGTGGAPTQKALDFRTALMEAGGCAFTAAVCADVGGRVYQFTLESEVPADGPARIAVTAPEEIAGITAEISQDGAQLSFDGAALDFGALADGTAPLTLPWLLGESWTGDYIAAAGADGALERVTYLHGYDDGTLTVDTWLDDQNLPVRCEVSYEGAKCLSAEISDFALYP